MKVEIEIPDWAKERHIYVLAGIEPVVILYCKPIVEGKKEEGWDSYSKKSKCNFCGLCCIMDEFDNPEGWPFGYKEIKIGGKIQSVCAKLEKQGDEYLCMAGSLKPMGCLILNPVKPKPLPECSLEYEKK